MSQANINIGTVANDGTGDPIRTAMSKINSNFNEVYSGFAFNTSTNNVTAANAVSIGSSLYVTTSANIGTYFTVNSTAASKTVNATFTGALTSFTGANTYIQNKLQIGNASGYNFDTTALIEIDASANTYTQIVMQNANTGTNATGDLVITADNGNDSFGYIDLGINSSNYSNASYNIGGAGDGYLYAANGALTIGTATVKDIVFHAGGTTTTNRILTINTSAVSVNSIPFNVGTYFTVNSTSASKTVNSSFSGANLNINTTNTNIASNTTFTATVSISGNTLNLGTSTNGANGYSYLPNGFKMNWGWVSANSTVGNVTFTSAYTTNAYVVTATSNSTVATYQAAVITTNNTVAAIRTANATSTNVFWTAIGY